MRRSRLRARRLASALLALWSGLNLAGCMDQNEASAGIADRARQLDPPQLWRAEVIDAAGKPQAPAVLLCADSVLRDGLMRAMAEVDGEPCQAYGPVTSRPGLYALKCKVGERRFALSTVSQGDPQKALTVSFALAELGEPHRAVAQARRYSLVGPCPAGWIVGQSAKAQ